MKKLTNFIKDFIYDITDYGLILTVIVIVGAILIWRLNILFSLDIAKEPIPPANIPNIEKPIKIPDQPDENLDVAEIPAEDPNEGQPSVEPSTPAEEYVDISIPQGTLPNEIAELLLTKGLINDKNEFLDKAVELELDRKLQSGDFKIKVGSTLENIVKAVAKAN